MDAIGLRPHPYLLRRGVGSAIAFFVPAFGALYFLTIPLGLWVGVVIAQVLLMILMALIYRGYVRLGVWVTPTGITEQGFFRRSRFERKQLGEAIFVNTFHGGWVDTVPQLFVCDGSGRQLIRMRGQFWSRESMLTVTSTLELPFTEIDRDVSTAELRAAYPGLLYWFERSPLLAAGLAATVLLAVGGVVCTLVVLIEDARISEHL